VTRDTDLRNHPEILWYGRFDDIFAVRADWSLFPHHYTGAVWPKVTFVDAPEYGMKAARFESMSLNPDTRIAGAGSDIMVWRKYLNENTRQMWTGTALGSSPLNDLYLRYCFMLEADVWTGINEVGVKLAGFATGSISTVMWHARPDAQNRIRLTTYWFGGDLQPGTFGGDWLQGHYLEPDRWYCVEQHFKVNTRNADGSINDDAELDVWLDDQLIFTRRNFRVHSSTTMPVEIQQVHGQIYHGGRNTPFTPIHYRMTGFALAKRRIGMPQRMF